MKKALLSGITGFAASHLAEALLSTGRWEVHGTKRARSNNENIAHIEGIKDIYVCDITDPYSVKEVVKKVQPDAIFHLAAQSFVPLSWKAPLMTFDTNVGGTINILEAAREMEVMPKVLVTSSSQVYGNAPIPFSLDTVPDPVNPYDVSKLAQELVAKSYFKSYGLPVVITRAFNITGPRRQEFMAESSFAKQIVRCERGLQNEISVGNMDSTRDYVDVRDVARAYMSVVEEGEAGKTYILASGVEHSMREVLTKLLYFSPKAIPVAIDPKLLRPSDTPRMKGIPTDADWWFQTIPFEQSLLDLLNYHRLRI